MIPPSPSAAYALRPAPGVGAPSHRVGVLRYVEQALSPLVGVASLWLLAWAIEGGIDARHLVLAVIVFALTFPGRSRIEMTPRRIAVDVAIGWCGVFGLLWVACVLLGYQAMFEPALLLAWAVAVPLLDTAAWLALRRGATALVRLQGPPVRAVLVGMNPHGLALAQRLRESVLGHVEVLGFADDRDAQRLAADASGFARLGDTAGLAALVQRERIDRIYITLPMTSQPRILKLLEDLKDTTASVYFVPDLFVTDLIQGRSEVLCGMPVISVCDSPFHGTAGLVKRASDIVLAVLILLLIAPALLAIALAVRLSSPGPVIFRQRRYGQDGEEIVVYKFRTMTVVEDGAVVTQARAGDQRVTRIGAVLRRTSLDELPQFVNVLQGRMSIVGPRPHAVAHNELYRKVIRGYMVRHKVKPGITGWAQVNGYRGETDTLEKMQGRVDHDLDYLRNWSLRLDLWIIVKTVKLVFRDSKAY
jgi:putative colanic acid biosynthesis UDP-glucose lipid carrier transferase